MPARKINFNYLNRDYQTLKSDLINYVKLYYPDHYNDFSEASVGMMLLELNAYVGDILSFHVDQTYSEMFIDTAQNRDSVMRISKNLGYKQRGMAPSVTLLDVSIDVPTYGDTYNEDYLITVEKGMKVKSTSGQRFEVTDDIDFSSHSSTTGVPNRTIDPVYNSSNEIMNYRITKRVAAVAGETKISSVEITAANAIPFFKWYPDGEDYQITEIMNVISKDNRYPPENESQWSDSGPYNVWYKVDTLPQERVFVDTSVTGGAEGYWKYIEKRYETDYDENGFCYMTFGAGIQDYNSYDDFLTNGVSALTVATLLNNDSYGEIPEIGTYLHCRYRTGGGSNTNAGQGTITKIDAKHVTYIPAGGALPASTVSSVINSLSVTNPIPAIGGRDFETIDEMKSNAKKHFSSQDRCVTIDDYISRVAQMPATYGTVFRSYAEADPNSMNTRLFILTRDENGKLKNTGNDQIKLNIASYLSKYKVLNDFIVINDGRIINLGVRFSVQVGKEFNKKDVITSCINAISNYLAVEKWDMNATIYLGEITDLLMDQPGVVNVASLQFFNKVGNGYSSDVLVTNENFNLYTASVLANHGEVEILPVNNKIRGSATSMFEVKYPTRDIRGAAL